VDHPELTPVERLKASVKQEALAYRSERGGSQQLLISVKKYKKVYINNIKTKSVKL